MRPTHNANFEDNAETAGHFANYSDYSRTLRAWLVAYGIGGPVLFVTNDKIADKLLLREMPETLL